MQILVVPDHEVDLLKPEKVPSNSTREKEISTPTTDTSRLLCKPLAKDSVVYISVQVILRKY